MNTDMRVRRYSTVAIILHWAIAALLVFQVALGFRMERETGATEFALFQLHKSVGISILLLVAIRLVWRLRRTPPPIHAKPWEIGLAHATHWTLYLLMLLLPLSGWVIISTSRIVVPTLLFGMIPWPHLPVPRLWHDGAAFLHENLVWALMALFLLHVAGALKHHFVDRDGEIGRMVPGVRPGSGTDFRLIAIAFGVAMAGGLGLRWWPVGVHAAASPAPPAQAERPIVSTPPAATTVPTSLATPAPAAIPTAEATPVGDKEPLSRWRIARSSTLKFRTTWSGGPIDGGFRDFGGDIRFSPDDLEHSRVAMTINLASVYSGDDQRDETLRSADWFAVANAAAATFTAVTFRHLGKDRYVADGTLKMKGVDLPSSVRFTLRIVGDQATMRGTATVNRSAYKIGEGEYASTDDIPASVAVTIAIDADRAK